MIKGFIDVRSIIISHKVENQGNVGKIENSQRNQRKVKEFCKILWKIKNFNFKEVYAYITLKYYQINCASIVSAILIVIYIAILNCSNI